MNVRNHNGVTALMRAMECENVDISALSLAHRANLDVRDNSGATALVEAACGRNTGAVKMLLDAGARWDPRHPCEIEAFRSVCEGSFSKAKECSSDTVHDHCEKNVQIVGVGGENLVELVELLIAANADVNARAPLIAAAKTPAVLSVLLNAGAEVNIRGRKGETALMAAVRMRCSDSVTLLLQKKANVNIMDFEQATALKYAVGNTDHDTLRLLAAAGAQPELGYHASVSPLFPALGLETPDMLRVLLNSKADVQKLTEVDTEPLENAVSQNKLDAITCLVDAGLDLSQSSKLSACLLNNTVLTSNIDMLHLLINAKALIDAVDPDENDRTPLMVAVFKHRDRFDIAEILLAAGAKVDACVSDEGPTVLWCDVVQRNPVLLKLLLQAYCRQTGYMAPLSKREDHIG